jgi:hypothetical protein
MQSTEFDNLTLITYYNHQPVSTKEISAKWFVFINRVYRDIGTTDGSYLKVIDKEQNEHIFMRSYGNSLVDSQDLNNIDQIAFRTLQSAIDEEIKAADRIIELERLAAEKKLQDEITAQKLIEEQQYHDSIRLKEELEKNEQSQAELESKFNLMVQARLQAEQEAIRLQAEHDKKIELLTNTLLPALEQNPLSVAEVLESEIMHLEIVQLAVATAIKNSDAACELVINSPENLWSTNFIIMEAIIVKVTYNNDLAQMIRNVFPSDHLLITMLDKVGKR